MSLLSALGIVAPTVIVDALSVIEPNRPDFPVSKKTPFGTYPKTGESVEGWRKNYQRSRCQGHDHGK